MLVWNDMIQLQMISYVNMIAYDTILSNIVWYDIQKSLSYGRTYSKLPRVTPLFQKIVPFSQPALPILRPIGPPLGDSSYLATRIGDSIVYIDISLLLLFPI